MSSDTETEYRSTVPAGHNLLESIRSQAEDQLHTHALYRFDSLITSGAFSDPARPAPYPPHTHTRYVTSLIAHPYYTTQTSRRRPHASEPVEAYRLQLRILKLIGPSGAELHDAWRFDKHERVSSRRARYNAHEGDSPLDAALLNGELANEENLFSLAEGLWPVVGWAFTCAVLHPARWEWWKLLLDAMVNAFERDWGQRLRFASDALDNTACQEALIVKMLPESMGSGGYRRVFRAILACGSGGAAKEWYEVFPEELRPRRKRRNGYNGMNSYLGAEDTDSEDEKAEDEAEDAAATAAAEKSKSPEGVADVEMEDFADEVSPNASSGWGGMDAVLLRQRLISLLSDVCSRGCWITPVEFFFEVGGNLRALSLPSFQLYTTTFLRDVDAAYSSSLNLLLLEKLISPSAPKAAPGEDGLNPSVMIRRFLPFPAASQSLEQNARVAMLLDAEMRLLATSGYECWSPELEDAVERGIAAREEKVLVLGAGGRGRGRRKVVAEETEALMSGQARALWKAAEGRLRAWTAVLKRQAQAKAKVKAP